ncbi:hypothetical protein ACCC92_03315 [Mucilaginibacter sp. Mucisp84]|uniref:nSTAND3 domain-containing NTPase n=1 Tax=Mucilaginibacter sp. Mucisp84 TaxID=3243058 RepID=UPI0039A6BE77
MSNYDFSTLNGSDLEDLVCDLLNEQNKSQGNGIVYHTYKDGKDKGIDFRYSKKGNDNHIVGQVKHYLNSGIDVLIKDLKKTERDKVIKLNPERYVFATSLDLSVQKAEDILQIFEPYIKSENDIYGKKALNALLDTYPLVIDRHFKLWYSSSEVLQKILHFQFTGRSLEFSEEYLKRKLNLYVKPSNFDNTRALLRKNKFIIITGDPGTGKTTFAELLVYEFIKDDYSLTYIYDDVKDIDLQLRHDDSKQIFYFDDFLGHNSVEIQKAKGSESFLLMILRKILNEENKFLVLTTRSSILLSAIEESQRLKDFNLKSFQSTVELKTYTQDIKLQILRNHAEFADIDSGFKDILKRRDIQLFIINHSSFSPRSVEYITTRHRIEHLKPDQYKDFIYKNFNYPDEIWRSAYLEQIDDLQRILLNTMFSLGDVVSKKYLSIAFDARLDYEVRNHNFVKPLYVYQKTFGKLYGSFIVDDHRYKTGGFYRFNNPSLVDFLIKFIASNDDEIRRITLSAAYLGQLSTRFYVLNQKHKAASLPAELKARLLSQDFVSVDLDENKLLLFLLLLRYVKSPEAINLACTVLNEIEDFDEALEDNHEEFKILFETVKNQKVIDVLNELGMKLFAPIIDDEYEIEKIITTCNLIVDKFQVDPKQLFVRPDKLHNSIQDRFFEDLEQELDDLRGYITSDDELDEVWDKYTQQASELDRFGIRIMSFGSYFDYADWAEVIMHNQFRHSLDNDKD